MTPTAAPAPGGATWEQLAAELAEVGVPANQARLYALLVRQGPSSATELARELRTSRPRVYRLLDALAHEGFVTAGVGRPRLFAPSPPALVVGLLRERSQHALAHLDRVQGLLAARLESLRRQSDRVQASHFTVIRGTDALSNAAVALCRAAKTRIDVLLGHPATRPILDPMVRHDLLLEKQSEGVEVRLLAHHEVELPRMPALKRRSLDHEALATLLVADARDVLLVTDGAGPSPDPRERTIGVRSDAATFVRTQGLLFERLWENAAGPKPASARRS